MASGINGFSQIRYNFFFWSGLSISTNFNKRQKWGKEIKVGKVVNLKDIKEESNKHGRIEEKLI